VHQFATEPARAVDRLADVRDDPVTPAAHFISEDSESSGPSSSDRALSYDTTGGAPRIRDSRLLNDETPLGQSYLERGVVEIARRPSLSERFDRLENPPIHLDRTVARAQRKPAEVDRGFARGDLHRDLHTDLAVHEPGPLGALLSRLGPRDSDTTVDQPVA